MDGYTKQLKKMLKKNGCYFVRSEKTARRDIADLKQKGVIVFSGAVKNGSYKFHDIDLGV